MQCSLDQNRDQNIFANFLATINDAIGERIVSTFIASDTMD